MKRGITLIQLSIVMAVFAAAASSYGQSRLFNETWDTNGADLPLVAPAAGTFSRDNDWTYNIPTGGGTYALQKPGGPLTTYALGQTAEGGTGNATSTFDCVNVTPWPAAREEKITLRAVFHPNAPAGSGGQRQFRIFFMDDAGNNEYGILIDNRADDTVEFAYQVRANSTNAIIDITSTGRPQTTRAYTFTTTFTINSAGSQTMVDYSIVDDMGVNYVPPVTAASVPRVINGVTLTKVQLFSLYRCREDIDDISICLTPGPPKPILSAAPDPMYVNAQASTTAQGTFTIANAGSADLTVDSVDITNQSPGTPFSIVGGFSGPKTVTPSTGATPSIPLTIQFDDSLASNDAPASASITIVSDTLGVPGSITTVLLYGYRIDTFTWSGAASTWDTATTWTPNGVPGREDTAIVASGAVARSRNLFIDPLNAAQNTALTSLSLTGGAINMAANNFAVGNTASGAASFTQEGGTINASKVQVASAGNAQGTYTMLGGQVTAASNFDVGAGGIGAFNLVDGSINASAESRLGTGAHSQGAMNITTGSLTVNAAFILGNSNPSTGVVTMHGGAVKTTSGNAITVAGGINSHGQWTQTGGVLTSGNNLTIGNANGARGIYELTAPAALTVGLDLIAGNNGAGDFIMHSGTANVNGAVRVGSAGNFSMAGGSLSATRIVSSGAPPISGWSWTGGSIAVSTASLLIDLTNGGGALSPGGAGIGTTEFTQNTTYTQTAGSLAIGIQDIGVADRLLLSSATANLLGGSIDVSLTGAGPDAGGSWDVIVATGNGSIDIGAVTVTLPAPAGYWSITSDSAKVTVTFVKPPTLVTDAGTTVVIKTIDLSTGATSDSKTFHIWNAGESNLDISSITLAGANFTLLQPTTTPLTLTPGSPDSVTVEFDAPNTNEATYYGSLTFASNDPNSPLTLGLQAAVVAAQKPASGVETWIRY